MKHITQFTHEEAKLFLLKEESYFSLDLPRYFVFKELIEKISHKINGKTIEEFYKNYNPANGKPTKPFPSELERINHTLMNNKDGKYAWRPFQLIHPAIYVALVHKITEEANWRIIVDRFIEFSINPQIKCHSIPIVSETESSDKAVSIMNWWQNIEQSSLELALKFEYVMHTDITDCYGSIYTHSIPWALHTRTFSKENREITHIGNLIDKYLRDMAYGQTNGIPQGSVLMDFISEMILGYADLKLSKRISDAGILDFQILRYRDDYRIFTNNPQDAEAITKYLTEILIGLGMRLNPHKTIISNNVIRDSVKPDKLYWIAAKRSMNNLQSHLLLIHKLSEKFQNSGSLVKALDKFYNRIEKIEGTEENISVLISILVDIGYKNPRSYPVVCGIMSKFLSFLSDKTAQEIILMQVKNRFKKIPNTGHLEIWLQRITLKLDRNIQYEETLCKKINDDSVVIWNSDWLNDEFKDMINQTKIINENVIENLDTIIKTDEIQLFDY